MKERDAFEATVARWNHAAEPYGRFIQKWVVFREFADRLVGEVPASFDGVAVDLGAGTGLVTARLLERCPRARVWLADPAEAMLVLARELLGDSIEGALRCSAEELAPELPDFDVALSSAAMHMADLERVIASVAARLRPGGCFLFNLWGHSFDETASADRWSTWRESALEALRRHGHHSVQLPESRPTRPVSRRSIEAWGVAAGLRATEIRVEPAPVPAELSLDCASLFAGFLADLSPAERDEVLTTARSIANPEPLELAMVRVRLDR